MLVLVSLGVAGVVDASAAPGSELWATTYDGPRHGSDSATALGVSPDGSSVFITGGTFGLRRGYDYATVAYDGVTGAELWASRYDGGERLSDSAAALGVSPDGSVVFVTGTSTGSATGWDYATVAYQAATGTRLWASRYDGPRGGGRDHVRSLGVSPDGSAVFVTGRSAGSTSDDYATVAYDASTGARLWARRYDGPRNATDSAVALRVSPDGSAVFVTGESSRDADAYATVAYDATTGSRLWVRRYHDPKLPSVSDSPTALGVSPDGSAVFVTGTHASADAAFLTVAYDASSGSRLWVRRSHGHENSSHVATALGVSPDGSAVFVTGARFTSERTDYATVAYDAVTGVRLWAMRYAGSDNLATALGVSPDGSAVFVTGRGSPTGEHGFATVAYDTATGAELWATRDGPGTYSYATALGVRPDGSAVFVTGFASGSTGTDAITVAYDTSAGV